MDKSSKKIVDTFGNKYFFVSEEANSPNNSSNNLKNLIEMVVPVANRLNRHLNIYSYNQEEGIHFVCRVLPGGMVTDKKFIEGPFVATASEIKENLVSLSLTRGEETKTIATFVEGDSAQLFGTPEVQYILADIVHFRRGTITKKVPKPFHRKLRDKEVGEKLLDLYDIDRDEDTVSIVLK